MKNTILTLTLIIHTFCITFGQQNTEFYLFTEEIQTKIDTDTVAWKYQTGAVNYSFIGDYKNTLKVWDEGMTPRIYTPYSSDSAYFEMATIQNAKDYISNRAKKEQVVIINEAHHNPKHRTFTRSLLDGLYKNGYRYLGLEAIYDSSINERNYPVKESGHYTNEPEFGNLIYEARKIGFIIFGYEASPGKNGKEREIEQAKNIQEFMKVNSDGKYLIHCGFDHVYENEVRNWEKAMAGRLKEYTNIDPFTINQVMYTEKSKAEFGHPFLYATQEEEPFVLINENDEVFNGFSEPKQTDLIIIHPITKYTNERPNWLSFGKNEFWMTKSKLESYTYPIQVLAYRINEYENKGIPADIIEVKTEQTNKPLYLQHGEYKIVVRNNLYEIIDTFHVFIEE